MDIKLYLIILISLLSFVVVGLFLYNYFNRNTNTTNKETKLNVNGVCGILKKWGIGICKTSESFADDSSEVVVEPPGGGPPGGPPVGPSENKTIDINSEDQLYNISTYYKPSEIISFYNYSSYYKAQLNLPLAHFLGMINLSKLNSFSPAMNKGFAQFNLFIDKIFNMGSITKLPLYISIMSIVNLVIYYNNIQDLDQQLYWIKYGIFINETLEEPSMSVSLTKCLPENNLVLYLYNRSSSELENIDCDKCIKTDGNTFWENVPQKTDSDTIYRVSVMDLLIDADMEFVKLIESTNIKEYNQIIDTYIAIIQFYINNSEALDILVTLEIENIKQFASESIPILIKDNYYLIYVYLDLISKYIDAINYVLPELPLYYGYDISNIQNIKNYVANLLA